MIETTGLGSIRSIPTSLVLPKSKTFSRNLVHEILQKGREDPVWFLKGFLGENPWSMQRKICRSVFRHRKTAVKACHSSGKTRISAGIMLTFFYLYPGCKIITTAPTWTQVEKLLWAEVHGLHGTLPKDMGGQLLTNELRGNRNWWAMGLSTDEGVRFQGHHAPKMLIIFDEAPGVKDEIWESVEGLRAGGDVHMLVIGNPVSVGGPFYDIFHGNATSDWATYTIDAFDTPNLKGVSIEQLLQMKEEELNLNPRPYLTTRRWVREMWKTCGMDPKHPAWQSRVRGMFPEQSEFSLFPLLWLETSRQKPKIDTGGKKITVGVDVAGPGDNETVVVIQNRGHILETHAFSETDPRDKVMAVLEPYRDRIDRINVDSIGIGYYMAMHIKSSYGNRVQTVNVQERSADPEKYANLKAELYWSLREKFMNQEIYGLRDEQMLAQLASLQYEHNSRGQIAIESKEDLQKRGLRSPDRAEALMLAMARPFNPGFVDYYRDILEEAKAREEAEKMGLLDALEAGRTGGPADGIG